MRRNTIYSEDANVLARHDAPDGQCILRLATPRCARAAQPGQFVHIRCHDELPMRRPYSIMRADADEGWIEILFSIVGKGSAYLAQQETGARLGCLGPIGVPLSLSPARDLPLLLGGGVGMPPMLFFAEALSSDKNILPRVLLASERRFPFETRRATDTFDGMPSSSLCCAHLEEAGVPSRLASQRGFEGCYQGYVHELADIWLTEVSRDVLARVEIFACGPEPMLRAVAMLARRYALPCRVVVEEYMACGIGGCAGCVIPTYRDGRRMMRRVCVDGPVFDAEEIYPEHCEQ